MCYKDLTKTTHSLSETTCSDKKEPHANGRTLVSFTMASRVLFSSQLTFPARKTSIYPPLTPSRNVLSFSYRSPVYRLAMRIRPLVKAASFAPTVAEADGSRDEAGRRKKLAVFVSGGGSNFKKIHEGCIGGSVKGDVVLLVTNKKGISFLLPLTLFALTWSLDLLNFGLLQYQIVEVLSMQRAMGFLS